MVFACQLDSFQRTLTSKVKSCKKIIEDNQELYEIICEDSILFPEGGGQPWDTGYLNCLPVSKVLRRGDEAVIYVNEPLPEGEEIEQIVDWERRFDHMQQHSGQHLITAIINANYNIDTTSWWLGEKVCHIELNTPNFSVEEIAKVEKLANEKILENTKVIVKLCNLGDESLKNARTRGLPENVKEPIRIVAIVGLEDDLCCGTHVNSLGQLQIIKLLHAEKGKKNKTNLFFLIGGRVLQSLTECLIREKQLTQLLKSEPASHAELVGKLQQNLKQKSKKHSEALKDVAAYDAWKFNELKVKPEYFCYYKKDGDTNYLECFLRSIKFQENLKTLFVLAAGGEQGNGTLVLYGEEEDVRNLGLGAAEILQGKGTFFHKKFQAKVSKLSNFRKVEFEVKNYFQNKASTNKEKDIINLKPNDRIL